MWNGSKNNVHLLGLEARVSVLAWDNLSRDISVIAKTVFCQPHWTINSSQSPLDPSQHVYAAKRNHEQRTFTKTRNSSKHFRHGITWHVTFRLLQKQFLCKPHCMINSSQCPLDPSQQVYSAKRQHEQRTFAKTRSLCKHFRHRITCHVTFQLLQKQFLCKPNCTINSSQCPLDPSQHVYSAKRNHEQRTFGKTRNSSKHLYGVTSHVTFQLLQKPFLCKPHCMITSSQCPLDPSQHVYSVKRQHKQRTFGKTRSELAGNWQTTSAWLVLAVFPCSIPSKMTTCMWKLSSVISFCSVQYHWIRFCSEKKKKKKR